jgi:pimeloyl-ACP methyl ester carboxylesterase
MASRSYADWYVGGHSLGGVMAADFAAKQAAELRGLVLLASYPTGDLAPSLRVLSISGSEDGVLNREKLEAGTRYLPEDAVLQVSPGGNHAQFGSYGPQKGDGEPRISPAEQWAETAAIILETMG